MPTEEKPAAAAPARKPPVGLLFRLSAISATVFVVTILAFVAMMFGDPNHPAALFLDQYGVTIILWEVAITLIIGVLAMGQDRIRILRDLARQKRAASSETTP